MATVFKVELEIVSHWVSYNEEQIKELLLYHLATWQHLEKQRGNDLQIHEPSVEKKV